MNTNPASKMKTKCKKKLRFMSDDHYVSLDASHRLQNSVSRLLDMIEETTSQLLEARTTQHELVDHVNIRDEDSNQMNNQVQELQDQLREEITAKEYLAVELHKAEGLFCTINAQIIKIFKKSINKSVIISLRSLFLSKTLSYLHMYTYNFYIYGTYKCFSLYMHCPTKSCTFSIRLFHFGVKKMCAFD